MRQLIRIELSQVATRTLQWSGVVIAFLLITYASIALSDNSIILFSRLSGKTLVDSSAAPSMVTAAVILLICAVGFIRPPRTKRWIVAVLGSYYIALALLSIWSTTMHSIELISISWLILLTTTGVICGRIALLIGDIVSLVAISVGWFAVAGGSANGYLLLVLMMMLSYFTAYFFYALRQSGLIKMRDYNKLKQRERLQTRRLKAVMNGLNDMVLSFDSNGIIRLYNAATLDLLDTNRDLIGIKIDSLIPLTNENGDRILVSQLYQSLRKATVRNDLIYQYKDGEKINLHITLLPLRGDFDTKAQSEIGGYIMIARDITKEKSLDDEKDEFISVVSHELRTPVAIAEGALSNLQFLMEKKADISTFSKTLDAAHNQILYLGQMVNDLSTLSRAQRGVYMDNESIDIKNFMESLKGKYQNDADNRKLYLKLVIDTDGAVSVPSMVIEEIMQNMITNALKYTKEGGVTIGVRPGSDKKHVEFYVKDTGIGISKTDLPHVFQRFWRSEDYRTRETSGTGLGLHVVDQLAHKVGAQVHVESRLNHGSRFSFELPRAV